MQENEAVALRQSAELESRKKQAKQQQKQKETGSSSRTSRHKKR
jgi:hypothetical protein